MVESVLVVGPFGLVNGLLNHPLQLVLEGVNLLLLLHQLLLQLLLGLLEQNQDSPDKVDDRYDDVEQKPGVDVVEKFQRAALGVAAGSCERFDEEEEDDGDKLDGEEIVEGEVAFEVPLDDVRAGVFYQQHEIDYLPVHLYLEYLTHDQVDRIGNQVRKGEVVTLFQCVQPIVYFHQEHPTTMKNSSKQHYQHPEYQQTGKIPQKVYETLLLLIFIQLISQNISNIGPPVLVAEDLRMPVV